MSDECKSYISGSSLCRDGFPTSAACRGFKCHGCGAWDQQGPACMREDLGPHLLDESGLPRFAHYRHSEPHRAAIERAVEAE